MGTAPPLPAPQSRFVRGAAAAVLVVVALVSTGLQPLPAYGKTVREYQWHLTELGIRQVHRISTGAGQVIAVIDTGVDASHPDLAGQVLPGTGFGADAAADGRSDAGDKGHGTAMASVIAATGEDATGLLGIAPDAQILPISLGTSINSTEMAEGIRWAVDHGATIINLSLGAVQGGSATGEEIAAVRYALEHDVVIVAAAGNAEQQGAAVNSPGNIPGIITVSGLDRAQELWAGSSRGPEVVVAAPAVEIIAGVPTTVADNGYVLSDGTSDAAAIVSGVAALVRSKFPSMTAPNIVNRMIVTASDLGAQGRDPEFGFGVVSPNAALTTTVAEVSEWPIATPPPPEPPASNAATRRSTVDAGPAAQNSAILLVVACITLLIALTLLARALYLRRQWTAGQGLRFDDVPEVSEFVPRPRDPVPPASPAVSTTATGRVAVPASTVVGRHSVPGQ